ncbi:hypothetical protein [uncultured Polaribacter sp.]|uniref:hypothetical protein n=1 Tax=uncultured Polaribacter sp. TaxID=174711 RepID=UPI0026055FF0|nr:hypothetical protein [uncultured Polaribacter sp.]
MTTKKYFSSQRFYLYLKYDLALNGKTYLFTLLGLCIVLFFINTFNLIDYTKQIQYIDNHKIDSVYNVNITFFKKSYLPPFLISLFIGILVSAGTAFPALGSNKKSLHYLLLPVSNLEKFVAQFLIRIVAFVLLYFILFWSIFKVSYLFFEIFEPISNTLKNYTILDPLTIYHKYKYAVFNVKSIHYYIFISLFLFVTFFAFAGASYFKKYALFKTVFAFAIIAFSVFLLQLLCSHIFYAHGENEFFELKLTKHFVSKRVTNHDLYYLVLFSGISLFLAPLAYFNLKEREV